MDTCSEKRTLGGLVRRRAFLAALMKADLGDWGQKKRQDELFVLLEKTRCESLCEWQAWMCWGSLKKMLLWDTAANTEKYNVYYFLFFFFAKSKLQFLSCTLHTEGAKGRKRTSFSNQFRKQNKHRPGIISISCIFQTARSWDFPCSDDYIYICSHSGKQRCVLQCCMLLGKKTLNTNVSLCDSQWQEEG